MKKRKILAMLMVAALSAGMLAGCGSDNTKEESKSTEAADTKESTEENKDTEETKEESTDESADQPEGTEEEVSGFPGMEKVQMRQQTIPALFWILQSLLPVFIMQRLR